MTYAMSAKRASVSDYFSEPLRPHQDRIVESHQSIKFDSGSDKTRCLVMGGVERCLEAGPFDRVADPKEDFDVILAISPDRDRTQDFEIDLLMARCSNPAAPLIADSGRFGARADVVLSDIAPGSIASALLVVQPLLERLHDLPRLPDGIDRDGLLALTLAYTRDVALEPKWAPNSESMIGYPMLLGVRDPRTKLQELAASGLLRRRFFERLFVCGQCRSSRMMAREVCVKCRSSHIEPLPLLHHYSCGFQGAQPLFQKGDGYHCPKCSKPLRHYGVDYDKPGTAFECQSCHDAMSEPDVYFVCADCGSTQASDGTARLTWCHYDITADGIAAARSGRISRNDVEDAGGNCRTLRDFRAQSRQALAVAARHARPIAGLRMTMDRASREPLGLARLDETILFAQEIAIQCLRPGDLAAALADGIVVCLPEADRPAAEQIATEIERAIAATVKSAPRVAFEIYTAKEMGSVIEALR
jgi:hypothetical protein